MYQMVLVFALMMAAVPVWALQLDGPQLEPINWESRQLTALDYDSDGRTDLSVIDGVGRAIDVYVQKDEPELVVEPNLSTDQPISRMSRFDKKTIALESLPASFVWGDFSGKGTVELAYVSIRDGLYFMQHDKKDAWRVKRYLGNLEGLSYTHNLWFGSLGEQLGNVLVGLFKGEVVLLKNYEVIQRYATLDSNPTFLNISDINHDGRMDIVYEYRSPTRIAYRLQREDGSFSAEELVEYNSETSKVFAFDKNRWSFFGAHESLVQESMLVPDDQKPRVEFYGMDFAASATLVVDIDADGKDEWIICDPQRGQMSLWKSQGASWAKAASYPVYKGVSHLAWDKASQSIICYSKTEKVVGVSHYNAKKNRMEFPKTIDTPEEAYALVEGAQGAWVVENKDAKFSLRKISKGKAAEESFELEGISRNPTAFVGFDLGSSEMLLVVLQPRSSTLFYRVGSDAKPMPLEVAASLNVRILKNLDKRSLGVADVDGDGQLELMLAADEMLRIFEIGKEKLELADQAVSASMSANLRLPMLWEDHLWAFETRRDVWVEFERDENGVWVQTSKELASPLEALDVVSLDKLEWVMLAKNGLFVLKPHTPGNRLEDENRWESPLKLKGYNLAMKENISEGDAIYILYNQAERMLEILDADTHKELLNFKLYDRDMHYSGRKGDDVEPREVVVADVTGDGLSDLAMLLHNRLMVYSQIKGE